MKTQKKTTYIALLRGINVGGHNVKMDVLRNLFVELGFDNVRSFIQSGNIFFDTFELDKKLLRQKIEKHLENSLRYNVPVCLRTIEEMDKILQLDPFKGIDVTADKRFAVTFLAEPTELNVSLPYFTPDKGYELIDKTPTELFIVWHLKSGRPSNSYGLIEKRTQVLATTRFWHTIAKILLAAHATKDEA